MFDLLNKGKDVALSAAIKMAVNKKIEKYGIISKLELNSKKKEMRLELFLKGEKEIVKVKVHKYNIEEKNNKHLLILKDVETSREWLNLVIQDYLFSQELEIPNEYVKIVKKII